MNCPTCSTEMRQDKTGAAWCPNKECEDSGYWHFCLDCQDWKREEEMSKFRPKSRCREHELARWDKSEAAASWPSASWRES